MQKENIELINPIDCRNWKFDDRSGFEYGDLYSLGIDIKNNKQIEPVVVRTSTQSNSKYEIISGSRRWKACLEMELPLLARVLKLTDEEAALYQIKENEKQPISDYSKGIHFAKLIDDKITTVEKISQMQNYSKQKIYDFLAFSKVPDVVWNAVVDMSKVSSRSAKIIYTLSNKGQQYIDALIDIAEEIRKGAGAKKIEALIMTIVLGETSNIEYRKEITNQQGETIAFWMKNGIMFQNGANIDQAKLEKAIVEVLGSEAS